MNPAELFGGDDHRYVFTIAAFAVSAVSAGSEAEDPHLGEVADELSGTSALCLCTCSAMGTISLSANARNVSCTISNSLSDDEDPADRRAMPRMRVPELVEERKRVAEGRALDPPHCLAPAHAAGQIVDHICGERACQSCFDIAFGAVVEHRFRSST